MHCFFSGVLLHRTFHLPDLRCPLRNKESAASLSSHDAGGRVWIEG